MNTINPIITFSINWVWAAKIDKIYQ